MAKLFIALELTFIGKSLQLRNFFQMFHYSKPCIKHFKQLS